MTLKAASELTFAFDRKVKTSMRISNTLASNIYSDPEYNGRRDSLNSTPIDIV